MVVGFSRSFSFTGSPRPKPALLRPYHARSVSLPCRSHPLISSLEDEIRSVKAWIHSSQPEPDSAASASTWICDGLARLELLHSSLNGLINLPQSQDALRRGSGSEWTGRVLEDFLRFADAHGSFRSEIVALQEHQSDAQVAMRRKDAAQLASCQRSMRKAEKELARLASSVRDVSKSVAMTATSIEEAELAGAIGEVVGVTASASMAVFLGTAGVSASAISAKSCWTPLKRLSPSRSLKIGGVRDEESEDWAMERMEIVEECVRAVEGRSERLFRRLLNTRVSLLNILTC